ncbi:leukocidin family pore-forming toxin [Chitinimonas sp. BJB300]|uniref:leukocidin family pore-forming toxin n=1 Tax=Chitinimonas sp. BJB300 TaxID=1559339 RepID=UPI000C0FF34D|nr:leukocidin family pore-forming toxin [Chitinimonas sp. BJB300]PHV11858.1 hypothetical protein CSQ89_08610 [Chitinimonas sp. BJB300]TSJ87779.1 hypothetical protein FG002_012665 [Chitinimonas sp. BJB300]
MMKSYKRNLVSMKYVGYVGLITAFSQNVLAQPINDNPSDLPASNQIVEYGFPSSTGQQVLDKFKAHTEKSPFSAENFQLAYYNISHLNKISFESVMQQINEKLSQDVIVVLDETQALSNTITDRFTSRLNGIELKKSLLLIKKINNSIHYYAVSPNGRNEYKIPNSLIIALSTGPAKRKKRSTENYQIGKTIYLNFLHENLSCPVKKEVKRGTWGGQMYLDGSLDPCSGAASYNTQIRLDYIPSKNISGTAATPEGKIVRIGTGLSGLSSAGWHIASNQGSTNTSLTANTKRNTRFGPFVNQYTTSIVPSDSDISLIDHLPHNSNPETQITETSIISVEEGFSGNLEIGSQGPKVGLHSNSVNRRQHQVSLSYKTNEYKVINSTSGKRFDIKWEKSSIPNLLNEKSDVGRGAWPVKGQLFTAMSYANFIPGYIATYLAPLNKKNKSTFNVSSSAEVGMAYTYVSPFVDGLPHYADFHNISLSDQITIDWNSPYFLSEVPVHLKAYRNRELFCLTMKGENNQVVGEKCNNSISQLWGLGSNNEYISFENPRLCLSVGDSANENQLVTKACDPSGFQEWSWGGTTSDKNLLVNEAVEKRVTIMSTDNNVAAIALMDMSHETTPANKSWKPYVQRPN